MTGFQIHFSDEVQQSPCYNFYGVPMLTVSSISISSLALLSVDYSTARAKKDWHIVICWAFESLLDSYFQQIWAI
ncbi:MAG: hypothetical protein CLLPBCKN_007457 [Chroococcidiopsis cubana SAG 39.79]|nr:hypothetical protein [Chroococcidiopsis cubana SAG 39.79]